MIKFGSGQKNQKKHNSVWVNKKALENQGQLEESADRTESNR